MAKGPVFLSKFYWNTIIPFHILIINDCFHDRIADVYMSHKTKNVYYLSFMENIS